MEQCVGGKDEWRENLRWSRAEGGRGKDGEAEEEGGRVNEENEKGERWRDEKRKKAEE